VIDVALLGIIRRWHIRDQVPLREIARRLGISRNCIFAPTLPPNGVSNLPGIRASNLPPIRIPILPSEN
jgi:hypothetical protein